MWLLRTGIWRIAFEHTCRQPAACFLFPRFSNSGMCLSACCPLQLYLSSDHRTLLKSSKRSWLQEVFLTDEVSYLNCWQAAFPDPQLRLEHEGFPIPVSMAEEGRGVRHAVGGGGRRSPAICETETRGGSKTYVLVPMFSLSLCPFVCILSLEGSVAPRQHSVPMFLSSACTVESSAELHKNPGAPALALRSG